MRKVIDSNGIVYTIRYGKFIEKENIKDSYIVWYITLDSKYEGLQFEHKQYIYYENLEESLHEDDFKFLESEEQ